MEWTSPTIEDFRARFPVYADVPSATLALIVAEAVGEVPSHWADMDRTSGVLYLAAHLVATEGLAGGASASDGGVAVTGAIKRRTVGDVTTEYAGAGGGSEAASSRFGSTLYGQRYLALLRRYTPTVFVV